MRDVHGSPTRTVLCAGLLALCLSLPARAQPVLQVEDIHTGSGGSEPTELVRLGAYVYFTADDGVHGSELWKSDGTPLGTRMVKDIRPGAVGSGPHELVVAGGKLFFAADDGAHGEELWTSDGSAAGTRMVVDLLVGASGLVSELMALGDTVLFKGIDENARSGLWMSTGGGTQFLASFGSLAGPGAVLGGELFFAAAELTHGWELWKSDGTAAGTQMVKDIDPGSGNSVPDHLTVVDGTLFFTANDGDTNHGDELWKSDGTASGTVLVRDIRPGGTNAYSLPLDLVNVRGRLFFTANDGVHGRELWKSDGTETGTVMIVDLGTSVISDLVALGDRVFFENFDGLWVSDGTAAGTERVRSVHITQYFGADRSLVNVGERLFFSGREDSTGRELWTSDGTPAGTYRVYDVYPGASDSFPSYFIGLGESVLFAAADTRGRELWRVDLPPGAATALSPAGDILEESPTYRWSAVGTASAYTLFTPHGSEVLSSSHACGGAECSRTQGNLAAGQYSWRVQTANAAGDGPASSVKEFAVLPHPRTLTIGVGGSGAVGSSPPGIACDGSAGSDCQEAFADGAVVQLTVMPDPGWYFSRWDGCPDDGRITMSISKSCDAFFQPCQAEVHLRDVDLGGMQEIVACDLLDAERVGILAGSEIVLGAGRVIAFGELFRVERNASFRAGLYEAN